MMLNNKVFNIHNTLIPFTKKEMETVISKNVTVGYVTTDYYNLIDTLQNIATAKQIPVTLNVNTIYNYTNNPIDRKDVLIKVEGIQTYQEYINNAVNGDDDSDYLTFSTYSSLFKNSVEELKINTYKKFLWNYHNIDSWFTHNNIGLPTDTKNRLIQDFDYFKDLVLNTNDYLKFIDSCLDEDIKKAVNYMIKSGLNILNRYKTELNAHIANTNKQEKEIILNNPIILKIYMLGTMAAQCRKDWPKLKFSVLDKKSLDSIALWEE